MTDKRVTVVGFGNPLRGDEGIGPYLIEQLQRRDVLEYDERDSVHFVDLGTSAMRLLNEMSCSKKLIIIDCAYMGFAPGHLERFDPDSVFTTKQVSTVSFHDADIMRVLQLARDLGDSPEEVVIFGIQPASIDYTIGLSAALQGRIQEYLTAIVAEVRVRPKQT